VLLTNHVLSGALIGALARRPGTAFAAGVASHFVLDAVPHWGEWGSRRRFLRVAVTDGLVSLAVMGVFAAASPPGRRLAVVAGMTGAALPDIDKPTCLWFGWSPWPGAVDRFHSGIQREARDRAWVEMAAAGALAAALVVTRTPPLTAGTGGRPGPPGPRA
jgi:hypothetical protein